MKPTKQERKAYRLAKHALRYDEHTEEIQAIIRASMNGREPHPRDGRLYIVHKHVPPPEFDLLETTYHVCLCGQQYPYNGFMMYTVEDYGTHYRVRGDGKYDRWHTVQKRR